jgi:hypothetical protein
MTEFFFFWQKMGGGKRTVSCDLAITFAAVVSSALWMVGGVDRDRFYKTHFRTKTFTTKFWHTYLRHKTTYIILSQYILCTILDFKEPVLIPPMTPYIHLNWTKLSLIRKFRPKRFHKIDPSSCSIINVSQHSETPTTLYLHWDLTPDCPEEAGSFQVLAKHRKFLACDETIGRGSESQFRTNQVCIVTRSQSYDRELQRQHCKNLQRHE